jgi:hypothetical protein
MAVYKQFNTNEVVVSPFKANKRFRFENNQVSSSDVCIEYYQSQQGTYLSGSFDTGFNTMQDGVNIFHSIKQLYYSNYLTSSWGDPMVTASFRSGGTGPQDQNLGQNSIVGNITGPRFENFLQSSVTQDRKFAQFSASVAPIGEAGTNTNVSESIDVNYNATPDSINIIFNAGEPNLESVGIDETYVLSTATWNGNLADSPFESALAPFFVGAFISNNNSTLTVASGTAPSFITNIALNQFPQTGVGKDAEIRIAWDATKVLNIEFTVAGEDYSAGDILTITADILNPLIPSATTQFTPGTSVQFIVEESDLNISPVQTINASQLVEERINPDVFLVADTPLGRGLTLKSNDVYNFITTAAADTITLTYLQAPRGPSVISIPSMLYGEAIQPSSFRFEYTSSINFTRSIVDDDGQGNLIATQSSSPSTPGNPGVPYWSGSIGQIFYSQGIAVITGPDSGSLREFAHNVGYKDNMNPNIISSSLSYSSSITIDENQYKCTVRESEFTFTTNPSALGVPGVLTTKPGQLFQSFDIGTISPVVGTYAIQPKTLLGTTNASTYYVFKDGDNNTIGQQYKIELRTVGNKSLEFIGWDGNGNGRRNALGQVQFNSTGSPAGIAQGFCDAINSVEGFNGEISCSLFTTQVANDSVHLIQSQAGEIGNTRIKYADSFNLLTFQDVNYAPQPARGQEYFGNTLLGQTNYNIDGVDTYTGNKGAILNVTVNGAPRVVSIEVSSSNASNLTIAETFGGKNYNVGDILEIKGSDLGGSGIGYLNLVTDDVVKSNNVEVYHDFCTGSLFTPYVTTVGLYNEGNELVCVGKLARPLPISLYTDTTFMINFDTN